MFNLSKRNKAFFAVITMLLFMALACNTAERYQAATTNTTTTEPVTDSQPDAVADSQPKPVDYGFVFELHVAVSPVVGQNRQCIQPGEYVAVKVELKPSPGLRFDTGFPNVFNIQYLGSDGNLAQVSINGTTTSLQRGVLNPAIMDMIGYSDWNAPYRFLSNIPLVIYTGSNPEHACFEIQKTDFVIKGVPKPE